MYVQGCLKREQERVKSFLLERDRKIQIKNAQLELGVKKSMKKDASHPTAERLSSASAVMSTLPGTDDGKTTQNGTKSGHGGSTTSLDRHRPGAARLHGSFRQYKKEREKSRLLQQQSLQTSNPNIPLDLTISCKDHGKDLTSKSESSNLSSSSNNSSPSTLPRQQVIIRPNQHPPLRQTRSCSGATESRLSLDNKSIDNYDSSKSEESLSPRRISLSVSDKTTYNSSTFPRKGILKATSSYNGSSPVTISMNNTNNTILENFSQIGGSSLDQKNEYNSRSIIESLTKEELNDKLVICSENLKLNSDTPIQKTNLDKKNVISIGNGEKSDSGRESDECPSSTTENSPSDDSLSWKSLPIDEKNIRHAPIKSNKTLDLSPGKSIIPVPKPIRSKHRSSLTSSGSSANSSFDASYDSGLSLTKDYSSSTSDSSLSEQYQILPKVPTLGNNNLLTSEAPSETHSRGSFKRDIIEQSINTSSIRKKKPMPPPRSSMTKLTTVNKKSALEVNTSIASNRDDSEPPMVAPPCPPVQISTAGASSINETSKGRLPPDPLRSLKQSALSHKTVQKNLGDNFRKNEGDHRANLVQRTSDKMVTASEKENSEANSNDKNEVTNTSSGLSQKDLQAISSSLFNLNKNNESRMSEPSKIVPKSILHTNSHDDAAQALDLLINTNTINEFNLSSRKSSKRVKFHPEVKLTKEKEITFDDTTKNKSTSNKEEQQNNNRIQNSTTFDAPKKSITSKKKEDISYYEPYV